MIQAIRTVSPRTNENSPTVILKRRMNLSAIVMTVSVYMVRCIWTDQNTTPLYYEEIDKDEYEYVLYKADSESKRHLW
jgi:hypothetical protein